MVRVWLARQNSETGPRKRSMYTRPFSLFGAGSGDETNQTLSLLEGPTVPWFYHGKILRDFSHDLLMGGFYVTCKVILVFLNCFFIWEDFTWDQSSYIKSSHIIATYGHNHQGEIYVWPLTSRKISPDRYAYYMWAESTATSCGCT